MRCLSCKYDLSKLTEHRCPECGRAFDPNVPSTFDTPDFKYRRICVRPLQAALTGYIAVLLMCMYWAFTERFPANANPDTWELIRMALLKTLLNWPWAFLLSFLGLTWGLPWLETFLAKFRRAH